MMRKGAKLDSYRLLSAALAQLRDLPWEWTAVGDGPARSAVEASFSLHGPGRVRFAGALAPDAIAALLRHSDVLVWPAIDEAFGMAFLEAQACGLPVVAGDSGGVSTVVAHGRGGWLVPSGDSTSFAQVLRRLLTNAPLRAAMGRSAYVRVRAEHDLRSAAAQLDDLLRRLVVPGAHPRDP